MSSLFDTLVRRRREATSWARMGIQPFLLEAAWCGASTKSEEPSKPASISVVYRGDVMSRMWWTVTWTGEDGESREASAQELDLALWRAAEMELAARARTKAAETGTPIPEDPQAEAAHCKAALEDCASRPCSCADDRVEDKGRCARCVAELALRGLKAGGG
jgi:hypothetical protein